MRKSRASLVYSYLLNIPLLRARPSEKSEEGLGDRLGVEVYYAPGMQARFRSAHNCMPICVYWNCKLQHTSKVQGHGK